MLELEKVISALESWEPRGTQLDTVDEPGLPRRGTIEPVGFAKNRKLGNLIASPVHAEVRRTHMPTVLVQTVQNPRSITPAARRANAHRQARCDLAFTSLLDEPD
jgi:hypothetical protein